MSDTKTPLRYRPSDVKIQKQRETVNEIKTDRWRMTEAKKRNRSKQYREANEVWQKQRTRNRTRQYGKKASWSVTETVKKEKARQYSEQAGEVCKVRKVRLPRHPCSRHLPPAPLKRTTRSRWRWRARQRNPPLTHYLTLWPHSFPFRVPFINTCFA